MKKLLALATFSALAMAAHADSFNLTFTGIALGGSGQIALDGNPENAGIAKLGFDYTNLTTSTSGHLVSVCADISHFLDGSSHPYESSLTPDDNSALGHAGHIVSTYFNAADTSDKATGLQLAVWEALYDNGVSYSPTDGHFTVNTDFGDSMTPGTVNYYATQFYTATSGVAVHLSSDAQGAQSQLTPVPEPCSMLALGAGVLGFLRRRRA